MLIDIKNLSLLQNKVKDIFLNMRCIFVTLGDLVLYKQIIPLVLYFYAQTFRMIVVCFN